MGRLMRSRVGEGGGAAARRRWRGVGALLLVVGGCGEHDQTVLLLEPPAVEAEEPAPPFLGLPPAAGDSASSPERLSETAAFVDLARLEAAPGVIPYSVLSPLWSDGAEKRRWLALPGGSPIGFSEQGAWAFPEGTVFIKHFGMALDERRPDEVRRLETRFLVAARDGEYYGLVYKWDDDQRDARLLLEGGEERLEIVNADGSLREQRYTYPAQSSCASCHSARSGYVIGARTAQLNGEYQPSADEPESDGARPSGNQLEAWAARELFGGSFTAATPSELGHLAPLGDEAASLEARVRSYWDSNCSSCHNDASPFPSWDARSSTPLDAQGVLMAEPRGAAADGVRLIVPGDPERSLIYLRSLSDQPGTRMPPLLRNRVDERYVELLRQWIESLAP